jgi:hypothetical protein
MLALMGVLLILTTPALAGRNANGALVVHTDDALLYTPGAFYCETSLPATCAELITQSNLPVEGPAGVIWLLAAFTPESDPAVTTIQFGIHHSMPPNQGYFPAYAACGPSPLELPDSGWPEPNDCGNLIAYSGPVYGHLFLFYWFAAIGVQDGFFGTRTYPGTNEAKFVDDGSPPVEDLILRFGTVQWGSSGANDCPVPIPVTGACCFPDDHCEVLGQADCLVLGGEYQGDDTTCDPNPCLVPAGACCFADGHCEVLTAAACVGYSGIWLGAEVPCDPNPCAQPPQACCFVSGNCTFMPPPDCELAGGTPMGFGTSCDQIACKAPALGACCFNDGTCLVTDEAGCAEQGGIYHAEVACEPNPCEVPIVPATWGSIKASFR